MKLLRTRFFYRAPADGCFLEEHKILLKTAPIAIPNDISKAYYQKELVIYFLRFFEFF